MQTNLTKGECGDCGNTKFEMYSSKSPKFRIFTECTECKSVSEIAITQPKLEIKFTDNSTGRLAFTNE